MFKLLSSGSELAYANMVMEADTGDNGGSGGGGDTGGDAGDAGDKGDQGDKGGNEGHWTEGMDEDTTTYLAGKGWDKMDRAEAFNNILKSNRGLEVKMGAGNDKLIMRPDMDDADAVNKFYSDLGRPDEATGYKAPEGEVDATFFGAMQEAMHARGLSTEQGEGIAADYQKFAASQLEAAQNQLQLTQDAEVNELRKDWGSDFDRRVTEAGRFSKEAGMPDQVQDLIENGKGSKALLEWTYKMSQATGSGETVNTQQDSHTTPKEAAGQMNSLLSEISVDQSRLIAYNKGKGADFEKMQKLISLASPSG